MYFFLKCRPCDEITPIIDAAPKTVKRFREGRQLKVFKLLLPPKNIAQKTLDKIFAEKINTTILAVFYHQDWERHLIAEVDAQNLHWETLNQTYDSNLLETILLLSHIPATCIEEVYNVSTWYVSIDDCITINAQDTIERASGEIDKFIIRGGRRKKFHHLIVVDQNNAILGVITKDSITHAIEVTPAGEDAGIVINHMVPVHRVVQFTHKSTPMIIRNEFSRDFRKWDLFRETRSIFLVDDQKTIVGFATDSDLLQNE